MRLFPPSIEETERFYFQELRCCSNSALREVRDIMQGTSTHFSESALRAGKITDAMLTQIYNLPEDITDTETLKAYKMTANAIKNPLVQLAMRKGESQAIFSRDIEIEYEGVPTIVKGKCMIDELIPSINTGFDYKTTAAKTAQEFLRVSIERYDYHIQAAWYMMVANLDRFVFIGMSKTKTTDPFVFEVKRGDHLWDMAMPEIMYRAYYYNILFPPAAC